MSTDQAEKQITCYNELGICQEYTVSEDSIGCADIYPFGDLRDCYPVGSINPDYDTFTPGDPPPLPLGDDGEPLDGCTIGSNDRCLTGEVCQLFTLGTSTTVAGVPVLATRCVPASSPTPPPPPPGEEEDEDEGGGGGPDPTVTPQQLSNAFLVRFDGFIENELPDAVTYRRNTSDRLSSYRIIVKNLSTGNSAFHIKATISNNTTGYINVVNTETDEILPRQSSTTVVNGILLEPLQSKELIVSFAKAGMDTALPIVPTLVFNLEALRQTTS
jgi:hypothetical protein